MTLLVKKTWLHDPFSKEKALFPSIFCRLPISYPGFAAQHKTTKQASLGRTNAVIFNLLW